MAQREGVVASGPIVPRLLLGAQLRRLRESHGVSREDAGWQIRASESKISRMELGRVGLKERDVADLLTLYGVADSKERAPLLTLARETNVPAWWQGYGDVLPSWFQSYLGLEAGASLIRTFEVQFVPGLLQTREYARAVILLGHAGEHPVTTERRVSLRMARQRALLLPDAPHLWAVVDEAALRRPIGGREVLRSQIEALIEANNMPNVKLQVMPFSVGGHAGAGGAFTILRFPDRDLPDVVYVEQLTSAQHLDRREDVERYTTVMTQLTIEAATPDRTAEILSSTLAELA